MKIDSVDFFYLSMPEVLDIGDGSQDALLVRVRAGGHEGWGECESAPLPTIAAFVCPMSHSACKPVSASVLGQELDGPGDIARIGALVRANSLDLLQADHALSGVDIAMWDLLGRKSGEPVWRMLGYKKSNPRLPYASMLFGATPAETLEKALEARKRGFGAVKLGWGPFGRGTAGADRDQVAAAREGLGRDATLLVDAGTVWVEDVGAARERVAALEEFGAGWLEEPFSAGALHAYRELASSCRTLKLAGGEGSHDFMMARQLMDHGGVGYIQVDAGRVGGITPARQAADYALGRGIIYVNHTFTSHLALSASLQPYAGHAAGLLCEYPVEAKPLAVGLTRERLERDSAGQVAAPDRPGLGVCPDLAEAAKYLVKTEITAGGRVLYRTPDL